MMFEVWMGEDRVPQEFSHVYTIMLDVLFGETMRHLKLPTATKVCFFFSGDRGQSSQTQSLEYSATVAALIVNVMVLDSLYNYGLGYLTCTST